VYLRVCVNIHRCRVRLYAVLQSLSIGPLVHVIPIVSGRHTLVRFYRLCRRAAKSRIYLYYASRRVIFLILLLSSSSRPRKFTLGESFDYFCFFYSILWMGMRYLYKVMRYYIILILFIVLFAINRWCYNMYGHYFKVKKSKKKTASSDSALFTAHNSNRFFYTIQYKIL